MGRRCRSQAEERLRGAVPARGDKRLQKGDSRAKKGYRPGTTSLACFALTRKNRAHSRLREDERLLRLGSLGAAPTAGS
jgi:hypothetical protein